MPKTAITVRMDDEILADLRKWMAAQPAQPSLTSAIEAAVDELLAAHPVDDDG
ncbi:hypothetical protein LCGC14_0259230 [marine sediment metagenome]|uniref:Ribbon-helix-helix protein CopG domain-containing protein n=1 Tax=marine sediment metagenome TaxID=412755 RepID=A0A0F9X7B5_9ZZZZ